MHLQISFKVRGDRRAVMEKIGSITLTKVWYTKAPLFAFRTGDWIVDRDGILTSPVFGMEVGQIYLADLVNTVAKKGVEAEGYLTVNVFPDDFQPETLDIINGMMAGKSTLLRHALGVHIEPEAHIVENEIVGKGFAFPFFPTVLTYPGIVSAIQFADRLTLQAASQKRAAAKERPIDNEKYAMRCFLLRIGMIGRVYADARKELLSRLSGNGSFKNGTHNSGHRPPSGPPRDCNTCANSMNKPEPQGGFAHLYCTVFQEFLVREDAVCENFKP